MGNSHIDKHHTVGQDNLQVRTNTIILETSRFVMDICTRGAKQVRQKLHDVIMAGGHRFTTRHRTGVKVQAHSLEVQYKHTEGRPAVERTADEVFLQGTFILGAHPAERF